MDYPRLGGSGLKVSRLAFGTARFGEFDDRKAAELIGAAIDSGVSTFDTADAYNGGASEAQLGPLLKAHRDRVVLCTKVGLRVGDAEADYASTSRNDGERWKRGIGPNDDGLSRKHLIDAVEASLRRLQTDRIDLYQVHRFDPDTPLEETLRTLDDLVRSGKVRYIGCSGFAAAQLRDALKVSNELGLPTFSSTQITYSIVARGAEQEMLPTCTDHQIGVLAFGAVAGGMLSGRYRPGEEPGIDTRLGSRQVFKRMYMTKENFEIVQRLQETTRQTGRTIAQLATGWVAGQPGISSVLAGFSNVGQLTELVDVIERPLSPDEVQLVATATGRG
jgi:1-deoxyxylulose-5-phosphate synthase